ncbi:MAG: hypothetical protein H0T89_08240 [Deltaproteobacteria bacterium]|nr:hypothetical protein [Deltaproteobacteria bacterium]MDQ3295155.1 hypothetical protein [Myxococcota bacterium]
MEDGTSTPESEPVPDDEQPAIPLDSALEFSSPQRGAFIRASTGPTVEVAGKVSDAVGRPLTINGTPVTYAADGTFRTLVMPKIGTNVIIAKLGDDGASAQRSFVYGRFVAATESVPSAVALRVNASGFDDGNADLDDLSTVAEEALAARNVMTLFPSSFNVSAPVVGTLRVSLPTRSAGRPNVRLAPRTGGVTGAVSLPSVYVKFDVAFNCLFTTCHVTGNVTSTRADLSLPVSIAVANGTLSAAGGSVGLTLVGFDYDIDGSLGGLAETVINFFIPDVRQRLESFLRAQIAKALPADVGVTLSQLSVPTSLTMPAPLSGRVNFAQRFDAASFSSTGGTIAAAVRASATFASGDPGLAAPGWLAVDSPVGTYRTTPAFGVSIANDFMNQILFAVWGQGSFDVDLPALDGTSTPGGTLGPVETKALTPPVVVGAQGALTIGVGDFMVTTTLDGEPFELVASLTSSLEVSLLTASSTARLELVGTPTFVVEVLKAPAHLNKGQLNDLLGALGSVLVIKLLDAVRVPVPRIPLAGIVPAYATKTLKLSSPAEVVIGGPSGRTTLYGRLSSP